MICLAQVSSDSTLFALLIAIVGEAIAILVVWRILGSNRSTGATISWILVILVAPYVGLLLYYLLGRRLHRRRLKRIEAAARSFEPIALQTASSLEQDNPAALNLLCGFDADAVHTGNSATLHPDGRGFHEAAAEAIRTAERYVHLQTYILRPDETGLRVLRTLADAAQRGTEVRLLYDSIGSWALKPRHLAELHEAGGESAAFMPLLWRHRPFTINLRNHRKQLIVDSDVAFCGGRNIGDEYASDRFGKSAKWLDTMVEIRGPAVNRLQRVFAEDWFTAAEKDISDPRYFPDIEAVADPGARIGVVDGGPDIHPSRHHLTLFQLLASAKQSVAISSPYLVPNQTILTALIAAAIRGVKVAIHTNGQRAEARILFHAKRFYYPVLLEAGVEIYETVQDYNHAKLVVVDEELLFVGSPNLDIRSDELNFELGTLIHGSSVVDAAVRMLEDRYSSSARVHPSDLSTGAMSRALQNVCHLLAPVL